MCSRSLLLFQYLLHHKRHLTSSKTGTHFVRVRRMCSMHVWSMCKQHVEDTQRHPRQGNGSQIGTMMYEVTQSDQSSLEGFKVYWSVSEPYWGLCRGHRTSCEIVKSEGVEMECAIVCPCHAVSLQCKCPYHHSTCHPPHEKLLARLEVGGVSSMVGVGCGGCSLFPHLTSPSSPACPSPRPLSPPS